MLHLGGSGLVNVCGYSVVSPLWTFACATLYTDYKSSYCMRDADGKMYAYMNVASNPYPWFNYGGNMPNLHLAYGTVEGAHVKQGVSYIQNEYISGQGFNFFRHYCFTGCNPVVNNIVSLSIDVGTISVGHLQCDCIPF